MKPKGKAYVDALEEWCNEKGIDVNKVHFLILSQGYNEDQHIERYLSQVKSELGILQSPVNTSNMKTSRRSNKWIWLVNALISFMALVINLPVALILNDDSHMVISFVVIVVCVVSFDMFVQCNKAKEVKSNDFETFVSIAGCHPSKASYRCLLSVYRAMRKNYLSKRHSPELKKELSLLKRMIQDLDKSIKNYRP